MGRGTGAAGRPSMEFRGKRLRLLLFRDRSLVMPLAAMREHRLWRKRHQ
jgi:hypothetical protein